MNDKFTKHVLGVFLLLFIITISYLGFFYVLNGGKVVASVYNNRLWQKRNNILRGNILDRDGKTLTESQRINDRVEIKYNDGKAFAHVLGYVDPVYGITGLQKLYDQELMGEERGGIFSVFKKKNNPERGYDVKTTLHQGLQNRAYALLGKSKGAVVMMDPRTGEILTMVSTPSYDPNYLRDNWKVISKSDDSPLINRATAGLYPPASTFKVISTIASLEYLDGIGKEIIDDTGILKYDGVEILTNYKSKPHGEVDLREAFLLSSNVYFGEMGIRLGNEKVKRTAERFHYNKDIKSRGFYINNSIFPEFDENQIAELAQSAIGQTEVLATPMEVLITASIIANNGVLMRPYLVKEVLDGEECIDDISPLKLERVISSRNASLVKSFMKDTVERGTGGAAKVLGLDVYGKTGTAEHEETPQKPPHSWFMGFAGKDGEPSIAFAVIVEQGGVGGGRAASIAKSLIEYANKEGLMD